MVTPTTSLRYIDSPHPKELQINRSDLRNLQNAPLSYRRHRKIIKAAESIIQRMKRSHCIKEYVANGEIELVYAPTEEMIAGGLRDCRR